MLLDVFKLIERLKTYSLDFTTTELLKSIEGQINAKFDSMQKREAYTTFKTGSTEEEKEKARQKYLDLAGIHKDFRYSKDFNNTHSE